MLVGGFWETVVHVLVLHFEFTIHCSSETVDLSTSGASDNAVFICKENKVSEVIGISSCSYDGDRPMLLLVLVRRIFVVWQIPHASSTTMSSRNH